jgi:hypothetical protein
MVALGPDVGEQVVGALPQLRPLAVAHNLRVHPASIGICTSSSDRLSWRGREWLAVLASPGFPFPPGDSVHDPLPAELGQ